MSTMLARDSVGQRVRALRQERGLTQDDLAGRLELGKSAVSRIESGERGLAASELAVLAGLLGISADWLLFGEEAEEVLLRAEGDAAAAVEFARGVAQDMEFVQALLA
jgi:transcriptional regulator with XRE-family HTH domain